LDLKLEGSEEIEALGIERLLADSNDAISLIPENNERYNRREE
jgi:lysine 2,3-aminomutase